MFSKTSGGTKALPRRASRIFSDSEVGPMQRRAAQYVRMSTDHQKYSTQNQADEIAKFALAMNYKIVRVYADEARSGLTIAGRPGLQRLIADIESGRAKFDAILVYDVSRWGRFQDTDESAYYEYICKKAGIRVEYCAEPFANDGSMLSLLAKNIQRMMAADFSRALSKRIFISKRRLTQLGFHPGGAAIYGFRRLVVTHEGEPRGEVRPGEYKALQSDHVVLVLGPPEELATVREVFGAFVDRGLGETAIARDLNDKGLRPQSGKPWTMNQIIGMLRNEKYAGVSVWNKESFKLRTPRVCNPKDEWLRVVNAIPQIISPELFARAQQRIEERRGQFDRGRMLDGLRRLLDIEGELSSDLINRCPAIPSAETYARAFGGLLKVYALIGYAPHRNYSNYSAAGQRIARQREILSKLERDLRQAGARTKLMAARTRLIVNDELSIAAKMLASIEVSPGTMRWRCARMSRSADLYVLARNAPGNKTIQDYYILPGGSLPIPPFSLGERSGPIAQCFRSDTLDPVISLVSRTQVSEVSHGSR